MTTTHPTFDQLGDLADGFTDGTATGDERAATEAHVASCAECSEVVRELRALLDEAGAVPREVTPPAGAWEGIRAEIERRRVRPIAAAAAGGAGRATPTFLARHGRLAAAMLVVAALSSATTAVLMRRGDRAPNAEVAVLDRAPAEADAAARPAVLPIAFRAAEAEYLRTARELSEALERGRATLAPETVATVERSLRTIDDAIGEAREALVRDPANDALQELLAGHYERKLDLLKRAAELSSTS